MEKDWNPSGWRPNPESVRFSEHAIGRRSCVLISFVTCECAHPQSVLAGGKLFPQGKLENRFCPRAYRAHHQPGFFKHNDDQ